MAKKITPEKPPGTGTSARDSRALRTGKVTKAEAQSMGGRLESERAAAKKSRKSTPKSR